LLRGKKKLLFYIYDVIVKQKIYKRSTNHYWGGSGHGPAAELAPTKGSELGDSDFVGAISGAGTPPPAKLQLLLLELLPKRACSCGCEGMRVKGDWRETEEEETREGWEKILPPPLRGLVLMLWSVPRASHCETLHRQSKR
jgi:hypothetical protein